MEQTARLMTALIRSEAGRLPFEYDGEKTLSDEQFKDLYLLSKKHDLANIVGKALERQGMLTGEKAEKRFGKEVLTAIFRVSRLTEALQNVCAAFEREKIEYLPLKGAVIRSFYPEPYLRASCDVDILVHEEDLKRACEVLTVKEGYELKERNFHDVSLFSPGGEHLELHFAITENKKNLDGVLSRVWSYTRPAAGGLYGREMDPAYLMFHLFAHASYHFTAGGCGVRPFVDLWLLERSMPYDRSVCDALLKECGILTFADAMRELAAVWFDGGEANARTRAMEEYLLHGGVYGSMENAAASSTVRKGGKLKALTVRLFLPYGTLKNYYPVLEKHPVLFPFCQVARWTRLLNKDKRKRSVKELKNKTSVSAEKQDEVRALLGELGLL